MTASRSIRLLCLISLLSFMLMACESRLNSENYAKLEMGMQYEEVVELLGKPARCDDMLTIKHCRWGDERRAIEVNFVANQVVFFAAENLR